MTMALGLMKRISIGHSSCGSGIPSLSTLALSMKVGLLGVLSDYSRNSSTIRNTGIFMNTCGMSCRLIARHRGGYDS